MTIPDLVNDNTACRKELGIHVLTEEFTIAGNANTNYEFAAYHAVEEFSGRFMLHCKTSNVSSVNLYLKDVSGNELHEPGTNQAYITPDMAYHFTSTVKYIKVRGTLASAGEATIQVLRISGATLDALTDTGTTFTDGSRYGNVLVRELFIPAEIVSQDSPRLAVLQVRDATHPSGTLITVVDMNSYNTDLNLFTRYFYSHDITSEVITLNGIGGYSGKTIYMVINWNRAWEYFSRDGLISAGEVIIKANIKEYEASHLRFSPTIAAFLEQGGGAEILNAVNLPTVEPFVREQFILDDSDNYVQCNVSNASELGNAISSNSHVIINLTNDITISNTIKINQHKNVIINGNGHKIFEYSKVYTSSVISGGRRIAPGDGIRVTSPMGFNTPDGTTLTLERSQMMKAVNWETIPGVDIDSENPDDVSRNIFIPDNIAIDTDNVYLCVSAWYRRFRVHIESWASNGKLNCSFNNELSDENTVKCLVKAQNRNTPSPYFFLSNYDSGGTPEGILIKNDTVKFPAIYNSVAEITQPYIFDIKPYAKAVFNNLKLIGGRQYVIQNHGELRLDNCEVTNKIGGGIYSMGMLFVNNCYFHDILQKGIQAQITNARVMYLEVTNSTFKDISWFGSNDFAVDCQSKGYIANNEFIDTNYGAISVGIMETEDELQRNTCLNLVEHNTIRYTSNWKTKRKKLALQDGGSIYVATNNKQAIIRFNKITDAGGPDYDTYGMSRGIFCDDGAYNLAIYGNIVANTEWNTWDHFDIDTRDCVDPDRKMPEGAITNVNNVVCYNICNGCLRMEEHCSTKSGPMPSANNCRFEKNIIVRPFSRFKDVSNLYINKINSEYHPYTAHTPVIYDTTGYIDSYGVVHSSVDYEALLGCGHIGAQM